MASWIGIGTSDPGDVGTNGKLGIGTGTGIPARKVEISDSVAGEFIALRLSNQQEPTSGSNAEQISIETFFQDTGSGAPGPKIKIHKEGSWYTDNERNAGISLYTTNAGTTVEKLRLTKDGNVGIGTTSPGARLDVRNSETEDILNLFDGGTEVLTVLDGGKVGIGTTNPTTLLNLSESGAGTPCLKLFESGTAGAGNKGILLFTARRSSDSAEEWLGYIQGISENGNSDGGIRIVSRYNGGDTDAIRIKSNGYVGIGTTSPGGLLELSKTSSPVIILDVNGTDKFTLGVDSGDNDKFKICTGGAITSNAKITIDSGGNVGIGTTSPPALFQVTQLITGIGTVTTNHTVSLVGSGTNFLNTFKVGDTITVQGETVRTISSITDNTHLAVSTAFSSSLSNLTYSLVGGDRFSVLGNGNVGIGTSSPASLLEIQDTDANPVLIINNKSDSAYDPSIQFMVGITTPEIFTIGIDSSDRERFKISNSTGLGSYDRFIVDPDGRIIIGGNNEIYIKNSLIGFGIDEPQAELHIYKPNPELLLQASGSSQSIGIFLQDSASTNMGKMWYDNTNSRLEIYGGGAHIYFKSDCIGIDVESPGAKLEVNGNIKIASGNVLKIGSDQVVGARQSHIADPSGGVTQDIQARAAINSILSALESHGLLASIS